MFMHFFNWRTQHTSSRVLSSDHNVNELFHLVFWISNQFLLLFWLQIKRKVVRERCCMKEDVVTRIERWMLWWFGHVWRICEMSVDWRHKFMEWMWMEAWGEVDLGVHNYLDYIGDVRKEIRFVPRRNWRRCSFDRSVIGTWVLSISVEHRRDGAYVQKKLSLTNLFYTVNISKQLCSCYNYLKKF